MSHASNITAGVYGKVIALLAPLFVDTASGDPQAARLAAIATLEGHSPCNDTELRLVAVVTAFGLAALDAPSRASNPDLTDNQVLRRQAPGSRGAGRN